VSGGEVLQRIAELSKDRCRFVRMSTRESDEVECSNVSSSALHKTAADDLGCSMLRQLWHPCEIRLFEETRVSASSEGDSMARCARATAAAGGDRFGNDTNRFRCADRTFPVGSDISSANSYVTFFRLHEGQL
jgi:hypothetical protein